MPSKYSIPFKKLQNPSSLISFLKHTNPNYDSYSKRPKTPKPSSSSKGGLLKMFKLFPLLTSGCKVVALLAKSHHLGRPLIPDHATIITLFGTRKGRITLTIQETPHSIPFFIVELPIHSSTLYKEMACDILRVALESENKNHKKKLMEEFVWGVYCNGRKMGYTIRRTKMNDDDAHVMHMLRGVSMGAGVLPPSSTNDHQQHHHCRSHQHDHHDLRDDNDKGKDDNGDEYTYLRARFERVVGSKDSEALYMLNPDHYSDGPELSIFLVRGSFN